MRGIYELFEEVTDDRAGNVRHRLPDLLLIAFLAVLGGAENCVEIAAFGRSKRRVLSRVMTLEHGIPSHDTFSRVFRLLNPEAFEAVFRRFMGAFAKALGTDGTTAPVIAIDGKALRGAVERAGSSTPLHLVTVWGAEQRLVLAQRLAPGRSEVTAARQIIALFDLAGNIVTADALHGSRRTAAAIKARGGDYALVIKGNRGPLHRAARDLFADAEPATAATRDDHAHGRDEQRRAWVIAVPGWDRSFNFEGLAAMARIDGRRRVDGREDYQTRYIALSSALDPAEVLRVVRAHWTIENCQHWLLDVAFGEDRAHTRNDNTAQNFALLRRLALNLLHSDTSKGSIRTKIKQIGWSDAFLTSLIRQMR